MWWESLWLWSFNSDPLAPTVEVPIVVDAEVAVVDVAVEAAEEEDEAVESSVSDSFESFVVVSLDDVR
mgnify:CR=1 FL=1